MQYDSFIIIIVLCYHYRCRYHYANYHRCQGAAVAVRLPLISYAIQWSAVHFCIFSTQKCANPFHRFCNSIYNPPFLVLWFVTLLTQKRAHNLFVHSFCLIQLPLCAIRVIYLSIHRLARNLSPSVISCKLQTALCVCLAFHHSHKSYKLLFSVLRNHLGTCTCRCEMTVSLSFYARRIHSSAICLHAAFWASRTQLPHSEHAAHNYVLRVFKCVSSPSIIVYYSSAIHFLYLVRFEACL